MFYKVNNRFRFKITDKDSEKFNLIKDAEDIMEAALACRESIDIFIIYLLRRYNYRTNENYNLGVSNYSCLGSFFVNPGLKGLQTIQGFITLIKNQYSRGEIDYKDISFIEKESGIVLLGSIPTKDRYALRKKDEYKNMRLKLRNDINIIRYFGEVVEFIQGNFTLESLRVLGRDVFELIINRLTENDVVEIKICDELDIKYDGKYFFIVSFERKSGCWASNLFESEIVQKRLVRLKRVSLMYDAEFIELFESYFSNIDNRKVKHQIEILTNTELNSMELSEKVMTNSTLKQGIRFEQFRYYGITNMPYEEFEKCSLPEFSGVYILRDEDNKRYVGQGKSVYSEIRKKFEKSSTSLVRKEYEKGKKFWIEDCICGFSDNRPLNLNILEAECIEVYQSHVLKNGYNQTYGNRKAAMYKGKRTK